MHAGPLGHTLRSLRVFSDMRDYSADARFDGQRDRFTESATAGGKLGEGR